MTAEGFEKAVREHGDRVHGHAVWLLRDRDEARDVAQEALVRLWQHRADVPEEAAKGWLLKTAHNLCLDRHRRRAVRQPADADPDTMADGSLSGSPERTAASAVLGGTLERALAHLNPRDRAAMLLREVEGLTYDEVADTLAMPLGTVKASLHRSREKLREILVREGVRP